MNKNEIILFLILKLKMNITGNVKFTDYANKLTANKNNPINFIGIDYNCTLYKFMYFLLKRLESKFPKYTNKIWTHDFIGFDIENKFNDNKNNY